MLAKRTSKNQITFPKAIVAGFEDIEYFEISRQDGRIILEPVQINQAEKVREKLNSLGIKERDLEDAIQYARKQS
ncbi:MAG: AbrB/MazE/SpoVT family DNA-binding domain-containing protein [Thiotrichaceae bacterium]